MKLVKFIVIFSAILAVAACSSGSRYKQMVSDSKEHRQYVRAIEAKNEALKEKVSRMESNIKNLEEKNERLLEDIQELERIATRLNNKFKDVKIVVDQHGVGVVDKQGEDVYVTTRKALR